jgi:hypothetical protein
VIGSELVVNGWSFSCLVENEPENVRGLGVLERLAAENLAPASEGSEAAPTCTAAVLRLEELVADCTGAIVIRVGPGVRTLVLEGAADVVDRGVVAWEANDVDPSCETRSYVTFDDGKTVFFPSDVELLIQVPAV